MINQRKLQALTSLFQVTGQEPTNGSVGDDNREPVLLRAALRRRGGYRRRRRLHTKIGIFEAHERGFQ